MKITIVGGGVFGLASAWELARRGHRVELHEAETIPAARAASRDISKALRAGYGPESPLYGPAVQRARSRWRELERLTGRAIYHEVGGLHLSTDFSRGTFERQSFEWLSSHGWPVREVSNAEVTSLLPGFVSQGLKGGYFDAWAGWLDPMQALPALAEAATKAGARIFDSSPIEDPLAVKADVTILCMGAWMVRHARLLHLEIRPTRQHEAFFELGRSESAAFQGTPFWTCDIARDGFYGFPWHESGIVKVACHVPGALADPDDDRGPDEDQSAHIGHFVARRLPGLRAARDVGRTCLYTMSPDAHFVFAQIPDHPGRFVVGAGSGHGFKFGPVLGEWAADLVLGQKLPLEFGLRVRPRTRVV